MKARTLNLGCGRDIRADSVNLDKHSAPGVDFVADVEEDGLTMFPDGSFDSVIANHVLEHIRDFDRVIHEINRVLRPGGILDARVPYGQRAIENPWHNGVVWKKRSLRQIVYPESPSLEKGRDNEWRLVLYRVRRRVKPWLHKPRIGLLWVPWVYEAEMHFTLQKPEDRDWSDYE